MSWREIASDPCRSSKAHRSARMFLVNSTLPAPMTVTLGIVRGSVADALETSKNARRASRRTSVPLGGPLVRHTGRRSKMTVSAYVLIQTEVGKASQVTRSIDDLSGIVQVDGVTGPYDVI